jgi:O-antigen/teichoic acid export membrane protein
MISKRFLQSSAIYTIGGALPMASGLALLPFYTDLLSIETYGLLMLYVAFSLFVQILTSYALDAYLGIHYIELEHDWKKAKQLVAEVGGLLLLLGAFWYIAAWIGGAFLFDRSFNLEGNLSFYPWGFLSVITGIFNGIFKVATNLLVYRREPLNYLVFNTVNFVLTIAISLVGLQLYPGELTGPMYGRVLSGLGIFFMAIVYLWKNYGISFRLRSLNGLHTFCFPYVVYLVLVWVLANVDRYIINSALDAGSVGLFDFALRCTMLIELLQNGLMAAVNPKVFLIWKNQNRVEGTIESNRYFNGFTVMSVAMAAGFSVIVPLVIPFVVKNSAYYNALSLMCVLASGYVLRGMYHYFLTPLLFQKKTKLLPLVFAASALVQIPLTYFFTLNWSLGGAVMANLLTKLLQAVFLYFAVRSFFAFRLNALKLLLVPLLFMGGQLAIWLREANFNVGLQAILLLSTVLLLSVVYRNEIKLHVARWGILKR